MAVVVMMMIMMKIKMKQCKKNRNLVSESTVKR